MTAWRAFVALPLPAVSRRLLETLAADLCPANARPVPPRNYHLTLYFLGQCDRHRLTAVADALEQARAHPPFQLELARIAPFPGPGGRLVAAEFHPCPALDRLQARITRSLPADMAPDDRPFRPHITLVRSRGKLACEPRIIPESEPGARWQVTEFALYGSELTAEGSLYHRLGTFPLRGRDGASLKG